MPTPPPPTAMLTSAPGIFEMCLFHRAPGDTEIGEEGLKAIEVHATRARARQWPRMAWVAQEDPGLRLPRATAATPALCAGARRRAWVRGSRLRSAQRPLGGTARRLRPLPGKGEPTPGRQRRRVPRHSQERMAPPPEGECPQGVHSARRQPLGGASHWTSHPTRANVVSSAQPVCTQDMPAWSARTRASLGEISVSSWPEGAHARELRCEPQRMGKNTLRLPLPCSFWHRASRFKCLCGGVPFIWVGQRWSSVDHRIGRGGLEVTGNNRFGLSDDAVPHVRRCRPWPVPLPFVCYGSAYLDCRRSCYAFMALAKWSYQTERR